jgi:crossover junction endodeoxyribonuclease RuvC
LGLDPGTAVTGYGVVQSDGPSLIECGVIRTNPRDALPQRLNDIYEGVKDIIGRYAPSALAVEDVFYAKNVRTTVVLGHARGIILLAGAQAGIAVYEYPPREIKKAVTGVGGATKEQVQYMMMRMLRLKSAPRPVDASDGVAAALTCCLTRRTVRS